MSEREEVDPVEGESTEPRLRRRLLGYRTADVAQILDQRDSELSTLAGELDEREAELERLRQDIAALWLAFAQHDRMISDLTEVLAATGAATRAAAAAVAAQDAGTGEGRGEVAAETRTRSVASPSEAQEAAAGEQRPQATPQTEPDDAADGAPEPSVGRRLADLDEVLAAIEMATQTLEQTYADEIEEPGASEPGGERSGGD